MNSRPPQNQWGKFVGVGIQMVVIICFCVFLGIKLDQKIKTKKPWFTLGLSLFGIFAAIAYAIRLFLRK